MDNPPIFFIGQIPKILWTTLRYFHWTHFENTVDNTPKILWTTLRYFHWTYSDNNVGQPSDKTACSKPCRALTPNIRDVPMHVKCDATAWYLLICMYACINIILTKLHVIQLRNKNHATGFFFVHISSSEKNSLHYYHFSHKKNCM